MLVMKSFTTGLPSSRHTLNAFKLSGNRLVRSMAADTYSVADQKLRHATAVKESNQRVLNIDEFYDGSYLKGKCILITGANRGLGLQLAEEAALQGAEVIATARKTTPELNEVKGNVKIVEGIDVANTSSVQKLLDHVGDGQLDIVLNNAGYFTKEMETMDAMDFEEELKQIDICAIGPLRVSSTLIKGNKVK